MTARRLVLDANILIRAVLGSRVSGLLIEYGGRVEFFAPELAYEEAERHLPKLLTQRGVPERVSLEALQVLRSLVLAIEPEVTDPLQEAALQRVGLRDLTDWPIAAAALALGCPIWTEDRDFFGSGIATWTTDRVELYLREP